MQLPESSFGMELSNRGDISLPLQLSGLQRMNSKFSYTGSSPVEWQRLRTEETGEQRVATEMHRQRNPVSQTGIKKVTDKEQTDCTNWAPKHVIKRQPGGPS